MDYRGYTGPAQKIENATNNTGIDQDLYDILIKNDGAYQLMKLLPGKFTSSQVSTPGHAQEQWAGIGQFLQKNNRHFEAIQIFEGLYFQMIKFQIESTTWVHKGMPLVFIAESHRSLNYSFHWKRFLMLTFCEDLIRESGKITPGLSGVYFRLAWNDLKEEYINKLGKEIYSSYLFNKALGMFPEYLLQKVRDKSWYNFPTSFEFNNFSINYYYLKLLVDSLETDKDGRTLELIADYLFSSMPGCKTRMRVGTHSTDFDLVCSMEGEISDFRTEFGTYFICECKSWSDKVDYSTMAKFCRVLDSAKMRFGILFSREGITGEKNNNAAAREQLKIFHDRGIVIVDISKVDFQNILEGLSLQDLLKEKYEKIRLDTY